MKPDNYVFGSLSITGLATSVSALIGLMLVALPAVAAGDSAPAPQAVSVQQIREWLAALGPLVAFLAAVIAAFYNAHLNRKRDDYLRRMEAQGLALALRAEIIVNSQYAKKGLERANEFIKGVKISKEMATGKIQIDLDNTLQFVKRLTNMPVSSDLYNESRGKIGLLDPRLSASVASYYASIALYRNQIGSGNSDINSQRESRNSYDYSTRTATLSSNDMGDNEKRQHDTSKFLDLFVMLLEMYNNMLDDISKTGSNLSAELQYFAEKD